VESSLPLFLRNNSYGSTLPNLHHGDAGEGISLNETELVKFLQQNLIFLRGGDVVQNHSGGETKIQMEEDRGQSYLPSYEREQYIQASAGLQATL
jgi:hypothetical protein